MPILVNGETHPWYEGLTVEQLLKEKKYSFPLKTVLINGQRVPKTDQVTWLVQDGDEIQVIHMMSGG